MRLAAFIAGVRRRPRVHVRGANQLLRLHHGDARAHRDRRHRPQRAARPHRPGVVRPRRLLRARRLHGGDPDARRSGASGPRCRSPRCVATLDRRAARAAGAAREGPVPRDGDDRLRLHRRARGGRMARRHRRAERPHGQPSRRVRLRRARRRPPVDRRRCACHAGVSLALAAKQIRARRCARCATPRSPPSRSASNPVRVKTAAFAISALCAGIAGALFARAVGLRHALDLRLLAVDPVRAGGDDRRRRLRRRAAGRRGDRGAAARVARRRSPSTGCCSSARCCSSCSGSRRRAWSEPRCACCLGAARRGLALRETGRSRMAPRGDPRGRRTSASRSAACAPRTTSRFEAQPGAGDQPDRPERRGQDHGAQHAERLLPPRRRHDPPRRRSRSRASRPGASRAPASRAPTRPRSSSAR